MKRGFTLIELSIVLLIIGLLIGGVMVGKGLITAAENQAIISDFEKYQVAANNYSRKYRAWPGDDDGATGRWSADLTVANGNGNGLLDWGSNEFYQFWLHLAKADYISGVYPGTATGLPGAVPAAAIEGHYVNHYYDGSFPARQAFLLSDGIGPNSYTNSPLAYSSLLAIDKKMDDGNLNAGNFQSWICFSATQCEGAIYIYKQ